MSDLHLPNDARANRVEVIRRLRALERIPPPPQEQQRLLRALADPGLELEALAELINQCPPVAARVMGVARSAFFATGAPVRSVHDAVVRVLGLRLVSDLVNCVALSSPLEVRRCPGFDPSRYWMSAVVTATLAQKISADAVSMDLESRRGAYLAGLLHNLGVLALVHLDADAMSAIFAASETRDDGALIGAERELLGITHGEAGDSLAAAWGLPSDIRAVMLYQRESSYRGDHWMLALLVGAATRLSAVLLDPECPPPEAPPELELLGADSERVVERCIELTGSLEALVQLAQQLA